MNTRDFSENYWLGTIQNNVYLFCMRALISFYFCVFVIVQVKAEPWDYRTVSSSVPDKAIDLPTTLFTHEVLTTLHHTR